MTGRKATAETRKMSEAHKGLNTWSKGRKLSDDQTQNKRSHQREETTAPFTKNTIGVAILRDDTVLDRWGLIASYLKVSERTARNEACRSTTTLQGIRSQREAERMAFCEKKHQSRLME